MRLTEGEEDIEVGEEVTKVAEVTKMRSVGKTVLP
jgi:hypothetical protein